MDGPEGQRLRNTPQAPRKDKSVVLEGGPRRLRRGYVARELCLADHCEDERAQQKFGAKQRGAKTYKR